MIVAQTKYEKLLENLSDLKSVLLAFSGGVDSTFLLHSCLQVLSPENICAVLVKSQFITKEEIKEAVQLSKIMGINLNIIEMNVLNNPDIYKNSTKRCYFCKREIFSELKKIGMAKNINNFLEGSNADDISDYRPGSVAVKELNFISPLKNANLTKEEIRDLSKKFKLPTWQKPALACLASRIPYDNEITVTKLNQVEKAEKIILDSNISNVRVRHHDTIARIEIPLNELDFFLNKDFREKIVSEIKKIGFKYVSLDLSGYRQGSLNDVILKN